MKAWIVSDIHRSPWDFVMPRTLDVPIADICICAGDISDSIERSIAFALDEIAPHMPVVLTLGNHDYYGRSVERALEDARKWTAGTNVHVLEDAVFQRKDLRVVGATLWTDFEISAHVHGQLSVDKRREIAIRECSRSLPDFVQIYRSDDRWVGEGGFISAAEMVSRHNKSRSFIEAALATSFTGTTMVLTHHAPSRRSLDPYFKGHVSNAAFASDLTGVIRSCKPELWVHGHVHHCADYIEGETRVLCNPRGNREALVSGFRPGFVIETTPEEG